MMYYDIKRCGERIRQLRMQSGFTQLKTADALNIDQSFYGRIEAGKRGCSVELFIQLSDLFGVSLDYLILGRSNNGPVKESDMLQLKSDIDDLSEHLEQFRMTLGQIMPNRHLNMPIGL